jgi:hypothetical protein
LLVVDVEVSAEVEEEDEVDWGSVVEGVDEGVSINEVVEVEDEEPQEVVVVVLAEAQKL